MCTGDGCRQAVTTGIGCEVRRTEGRQVQAPRQTGGSVARSVGRWVCTGVGCMQASQVGVRNQCRPWAQASDASHACMQASQQRSGLAAVQRWWLQGAGVMACGQLPSSSRLCEVQGNGHARAVGAGVTTGLVCELNVKVKVKGMRPEAWIKETLPVA